MNQKLAELPDKEKSMPRDLFGTLWELSEDLRIAREKGVGRSGAGNVARKVYVAYFCPVKEWEILRDLYIVSPSIFVTIHQRKF